MSNQASSSTSADPYAAYYYWDPALNNHSFDYNSFYLAQGYSVQEAQSLTTQALATAAAQQQQPIASTSTSTTTTTSSYPSTSTSTSNYGYGGSATASGSNSYSATQDPSSGKAERPKRQLPGPKDAEGQQIQGRLKRGEKRETVLRKAAGKLWEDQTLLEWDPTHKRLFIGDLGNDVSDQMLTSAFSKYASFSKARVIRAKHDGKSKGYGFVAFSEPSDFLKAWKEMDGKYLGSRPIRIKKAQEEQIAPSMINQRKDRLLASNTEYDEFKMRSKMGGAIGRDLRRNGVGKAWAVKK